LITGLCGGLQNYLAYSNSVAYDRAGGKGKISSLCIAFFTAILFLIGPQICAFIPRCAASVILFHLGIDLIQEAVIDSFDDFDIIEYVGIWFVMMVIAFYGIETGLLAGKLDEGSTSF
jgi:SulP family sulfate permease